MNLRKKITWVIRAIGLLALLVLGLFLGMNAAISFGLPVLLNAKPERLRIGWDVAWMIVPGEVEVRGLEIHTSGPKAQIDIAVDHATATIDLESLQQRVFHASLIRAEGAQFRFAPGVPADELPAPTKNPWQVILTDVVVEDLREIWLGDYRFLGRARVSTDGLDLLPRTHVGLEPTRLEIEDGQVVLGEETMLAGLHGQVFIDLDQLSPKDNPGRDLFSYLSAQVTLDARVQDLAFVGFYLKNAPWLQIRGGAGDLQMDLLMQDGAFQQGSRLQATVQDVEARFRSYGIKGEGNLLFEVTQSEAGTPESGFALSFADYAIHREGDGAPHVEGKGFRVTARTPDVALDAPFTTLNVVLELPESRIPDIRVYNSYLPEDIGLSLVEGTGTIEGRLEVSTPGNIGQGEMTLRGRGIRAKLDGLTIQGRLSLEARVPEARLDEGRYTISGTRLELRDIEISGAAGERQAAAGWWANLAIPRGVIIPGAPVFLDADLAVTLRDSVPLITIFSEQKKPLPDWVKGLLEIHDLSGRARLRLGPGLMELPVFEIAGDKGFSVSMQLQRKKLVTGGKLLARYGKLALGMRLRGSEKKLQVLHARRWYDEEPAFQ